MAKQLTNVKICKITMNLRRIFLQNKTNFAIWQALLAAFLFGISTPLSKMLMSRMEPFFLAGLLYAGSGIGLAAVKLIFNLSGVKNGHPLAKTDIPWLAGSVLSGGVLAPILLLFGLKYAAASMASLLLNFEVVFTAVIAMVFFKERTGKRMWLAVVLVTAGGIFISWQAGIEWKKLLPSLAVLGACFGWALDNNLTRKISGKDPVVIGIIKGFAAGAISLAIAVAVKNPLPQPDTAVFAMLLGVVSYGISVVLLILTFRHIGAARGATIFGTSPLVGAALSVVLLGEKPGLNFYLALVFMAAGTLTLLMETGKKGN
jgi:drug/metabolite transporter (DMT)-like permease